MVALAGTTACGRCMRQPVCRESGLGRTQKRINLGALTESTADLAKASVVRTRWQVEMRARLAAPVESARRKSRGSPRAAASRPMLKRFAPSGTSMFKWILIVVDSDGTKEIIKYQKCPEAQRYYGSLRESSADLGLRLEPIGRVIPIGAKAAKSA
jgi:hypothetical protein